MKTLNDFEIKVPSVTFNGGIPLSGCSFYFTFDMETYYEGMVDKIGCVKHKTSCYYNGLYPIVYFHSAIGKFYAVFSKADDGNAVCAKIFDITHNIYMDKKSFVLYDEKVDITRNRIMRIKYVYDIVKFKNMPFFQMGHCLDDTDALVMGRCFQNGCVSTNVYMEEFGIDEDNVAVDMKIYNPCLGKVNLDECFATVKDCLDSMKKNKNCGFAENRNGGQYHNNKHRR